MTVFLLFSVPMEQLCILKTQRIYCQLRIELEYDYTVCSNLPEYWRWWFGLKNIWIPSQPVSVYSPPQDSITEWLFLFYDDCDCLNVLNISPLCVQTCNKPLLFKAYHVHNNKVKCVKR